VVMTLPTRKRWARLGPNTPSWLIHVPESGVCLSAFVICRRDESILLARPHAHEAWPTKGGFPKRHAAELEREGTWILPATHLKMWESPNRGAVRIAREWAGLKGTPHFLMVQSHLRPSRVKKGSGEKHWDICFVYEMKTKELPRLKPWWAEMRFVKLKEIRQMDLGRGHKDILREAGFV
jgi:ADP-ribose pyrophosphatase YjhB (NUDIX family)